MLPEIFKEALSTPGFLKEVYGDLAKPGVQQVGKAIGGILGLGNTALYPIHLLNGRADSALRHNLDKYRSKLEEISEDGIVDVPAEIGVPILDKLAYVTDEVLGDMFISLLEKASVKESAYLVHPGHIEKLNSLSPDEAIILKCIYEDHVYGYRAYLKDRDRAENLFVPVMHCSLLDQLQFLNNIRLYEENLVTLSLVTYRWFTPRAGIWADQFFKENFGIGGGWTWSRNSVFDPDGYFKDASWENVERALPYELTLTALGNSFVKSCIG